MVNMTKTPMADLQKTARVSLAKHGLHADGKGGIKVRLVLDHSYSMAPWYSNGAVQRLTEQVLGLSAALDDDGITEAWFFESGVSEMYEIHLHPTAGPGQVPSLPRKRLFGRRTVAQAPDPGADPYYVGWVDRFHPQQPWGSTNYVAALRAVSGYRRKQGETEPTLLIFQTDGGPNDRQAASTQLQLMSGEDIFVAFVGFGREGSDGMDYLRQLDQITGRTRDNASAFVTGDAHSYAALSDESVYDGVLGEFVGQWLPQVL